MHVRFHKFNVTLPFDFHFSFHCIQQFLHMKRWLLPTYVLVYDVGKHVGTREHGKTTTRRLHAQKNFDQDFLIKSNYLFITFFSYLFGYCPACYNYSNRVLKKES